MNDIVNYGVGTAGLGVGAGAAYKAVVINQQVSQIVARESAHVGALSAYSDDVFRRLDAAMFGLRQELSEFFRANHRENYSNLNKVPFDGVDLRRAYGRAPHLNDVRRAFEEYAQGWKSQWMQEASKFFCKDAKRNFVPNPNLADKLWDDRIYCGVEKYHRSLDTFAFENKYTPKQTAHLFKTASGHEAAVRLFLAADKCVAAIMYDSSASSQPAAMRQAAYAARDALVIDPASGLNRLEAHAAKLRQSRNRYVAVAAGAALILAGWLGYQAASKNN
jgi:hypothetical protein